MTALSSWRTKTLVIKENKAFRLDSLPILMSSLTVFHANTGRKTSSDLYDFSYNQFTWKGEILPDTLDFRYQVLTVDLGYKFTRLDTNYIELDPTLPPDFVYDPFGENTSSNKDIFDIKGVQYSGSFSRGISFGNSQNLVLNSSFNLQMTGEIGDDIEISAAISDQNIPLQPEGNTQNIQDFDRVFIQLKRKRTSLKMGDFDLRRPDGYFMNYNKKLQGATLETAWNALGATWNMYGAFAISGGKFTRQNINTSEGNQGPYKLRGNENELFIIVLSGTERVFVDGILMKRGELNDYIIDYNRGEVTFTTNKLITKDSRVAVEFEYRDQNYLRFLYTGGLGMQKGKWSSRFNFYSENDSKNSTGQQKLTTAQIQFLTDIGDGFNGEYAPGIDSLKEFTTDRITYALKDSLVNGVLYSDILIYSTDPIAAKYTARFTELGQGKGNYILSNNAANGRVYEWVAPDAITNTPSGNFEPVVALIAPKSKQLMTLGGRYDIDKQAYIDIEGAISNNDLNRYSRVDAKDDKGTSFRIKYEQKHDLKARQLVEEKDTPSLWSLTSQANYEFKNRNFEALSPYRSSEFARDWNISNQGKLNEHLASGGLMLKHQQLGQISYHFGTFLRGASYRGYKHSYHSLFRKKGFQFQVKGSYLDSKNLEEKTHYHRPRADISQRLGIIKIGVKAAQEKNDRFNITTDSLLNNSLHFNTLGGYIQTTTSKKYKLGVNYQRRWDYHIKENAYRHSTLADEIAWNGNWKPSAVSNLNWNVTYRQLKIKDKTLTEQSEQETYLGRIHHQLKLAKGAIRSNTNYEISSGQEPELEFVYQKVQAGEGVYQWIDRNQDSIPQLDEFEVAIFQDQAEYIRVSTVTDRYVRSNLVQFSNSFFLSPKAVWFKEQKNTKAFLSKFAFQSNVKIRRKVRQDKQVNQWNPFAQNIPDTSLVTIHSSYRTVLFFNRGNRKYDLRLGLNYIQGRNVFTTGYERRNTQEHFLAARWNIAPLWTSHLELSQGKKRADSEYFNHKDYTIKWHKIAPKLTFQNRQKFRIITTFEYYQGQNQLATRENISKQDLNLEFKYNPSLKMTLRTKISFINVDFKGETNTPVSYVMLEGLRNGRNFLWNISFDRKLSKNLLLNLSYDGRKTGENAIVHLGRASLRANF